MGALEGFRRDDTTCAPPTPSACITTEDTMRNLLLLCALAVVLVPATAIAGGVVRSGSGGFSAIEAGVFEFGFDNMLLVNSHTQEVSAGSDDSVNVTRAAWVGSLTPRYFVARNFSVGLGLNLSLASQSMTVTIADQETTDESSDMVFMPIVSANYYIRLGHGMFFKPGIGGGAFFGTRSVPGTEPGTTFDSSLSGGAGLVDLGVAYYASQHVNFKAGVNIIARFGGETPDTGADDVEGIGFTDIDAGASVGIAYSF